jgi:hypothetical protein
MPVARHQKAQQLDLQFAAGTETGMAALGTKGR